MISSYFYSPLLLQYCFWSKYKFSVIQSYFKPYLSFIIYPLHLGYIQKQHMFHVHKSRLQVIEVKTIFYIIYN